MTGFIHLDCHSYFSLMRGVESPEALVRGAAELGMGALALTDLNGLYGAVWFWRAAGEAGVRPILGAEVVTETERAVLLVKSAKGYARLCEVLTDRHLEPDFSLGAALEQDRDGLAVLSADLNLLERLVRGDRGDLYASLVAGRDSRRVLDFARSRNLPPVAGADVHFVSGQGLELHRLLRAIDGNTTLTRVPASDLASPDSWLMSGAEMARRFPHCPEAVTNAARLGEECLLEEPPWSGLLFPDYNGLGPAESYRLLRSLCLSGARKRYGRITAPVRERLEYELRVIREKNFAGYFLVVEDIVRGFPRTCGRGSAAASIVSYCLFITHVEPIRRHLFFERFLNPGRVDPPDIDVDFPWDERDRVLDYVFEKYGERNAAMVSNHVSFQARAAVREAAKVRGLPAAEIKAVTRRMRGFWRSEGVEDLIANSAMFRGLRLGPPWPSIIEAAGKLEGIPRHLSVHSGGVVIAPRALARRVPLQRAKKGVNVIQWEKDQAEDGGLVKIDLLGNRSLAVIRDALAAVEDHGGPAIEYSSFNPLEDPATQELLARGETMGVFYVESPAMRQLQCKTGRGDFERLTVHSSIIRPAANEFIREYVRRLKGGPYDPLHPALDEILGETFGIMCYQEDVCKAAMALAGFDAVDGDGLRKVLSKKHRYKKLLEYKERFFRGASERGVALPTIEKIWDMIMSFSGYSFCKPHSASYALVSFKSAWLRAHHPAEFMAAVISNQGGYYSAFAYLSEARRMGLTVRGPDVNASEHHYTGRGSELRAGLMQLKGLSRAGAEALLEERRARGPYRCFDEFLRRAKVAASDTRLLIKAGCFDSIEGASSRPGLLWKLLAHEKEGRAAAPTLFDPPPASLPRPPGYDERTLLRHEAEVLGFLMSRHPLELYLPRLKPLSYVRGRDLGRWVGKRVTCLGWFVTGKLVETKRGEPMEFLSFEDTTALYETTFFPGVYRRFCSTIDRDRPFVLRGLVEEDFGAVTLTVADARPLEPPERRVCPSGRFASKVPMVYP